MNRTLLISITLFIFILGGITCASAVNLDARYLNAGNHDDRIIHYDNETPEPKEPRPPKDSSSQKLEVQTFQLC